MSSKRSNAPAEQDHENAHDSTYIGKKAPDAERSIVMLKTSTGHSKVLLQQGCRWNLGESIVGVTKEIKPIDFGAGNLKWHEIVVHMCLIKSKIDFRVIA